MAKLSAVRVLSLDWLSRYEEVDCVLRGIYLLPPSFLPPSFLDTIVFLQRVQGPILFLDFIRFLGPK